MMMVPPILKDIPKLREDVRRSVKQFGADVAWINFETGIDELDEPAIFFHVVLSDDASQEARLGHVAMNIRLRLMDDLDTYDNGVHAYFNFRSESEMATIDDPAWAAMT